MGCPCLCACVSVWRMRRQGRQRGHHRAALPTLPPGDEDAPACHCRHGYCRKKGCTHYLSSLLMCYREAWPTAALSLYYTHCAAVTNRTTFDSLKRAIMAISSLSQFRTACHFLKRLTHANICPRIAQSSRLLYLQ